MNKLKKAMAAFLALSSVAAYAVSASADDFRTGDGSGTGDPETGVPEADPSEENSRKTERSESGETGSTGLVLHVPGPVFQTEDFLRNHPMAAQGR